MADCRRPTRAAARVTLLGQQRIKRHEQVQVDAGQIDVVDDHYRSHLFDQ
jgi:hypothetical protein